MPLANLTVGEIMRRWPITVAIFLKYRLLCVGCAFAEFDTLEEALAEHSLAPEPFLSECRQAIEPYSVSLLED
jgi:hybrid cluster-associated redox disulfide protein